MLFFLCPCGRVYTLGSKRLLLCMAKSQLSSGVWWCRGRRRAVGSISLNFSGTRGTSPGSPTGRPAGIRIESQVPRQLPSIRIRGGGGGNRQLGGREIPRAPPGTATRPRGLGLRVRRPPCLQRTAQGHSTTLTRTHLLCSYREPEPVEKPIRAARNKDARGRPRNERQRLNHLWWLLLSPLPSCPFPSSSDPPIPRPCASVS
jgi:hypothetical protein